MKNWLDIIMGTARPPVPHPFRPKAKEKGTVVREAMPENIVYRSGRVFTQEDIGDNVIEDTVYRGQGSRSGSIGQADIELAKSRGLSPDRYAELKTYWASGLSAQDTAKMYKGVRGYGPRTLDNYWAAFYALRGGDTPPPSLGEGPTAKGPRNPANTGLTIEF